MSQGEEKLVHTLVERQAQQRPHKVAALHESSSLTFSELNCYADQICGVLSSFGQEVVQSFVAICVQRCPAMVVSMLGVLKAGSAFLPMDLSYPSERLRYMLKDSMAKAVITHFSEVESHLMIDPDVIRLLRIDTLGKVDDSLMPPAVPSQSQQLGKAHAAYIIYTSGSTGNPKGVVVSHQNWRNVLLGFADLLKESLSEEATWSAITTYCFDISLLELFLPLISGCKLHIVGEDVQRNGPLLKSHLDQQKNNVFQATPATFMMLKSAGWTPSSNATLLCGGEAFPLPLTLLSTQCDAIFNVYGPTETTIWSTVYRVLQPAHMTSVPIGEPVRNTHLYLRGQTGDFLPIDEARQNPPNDPQELVIGGAGVSIGYWNLPELTSQRFPQRRRGGRAAGRVFRTGDSVQLNEAGELLCLGRIDEQVKLNGFRVELGEIEAVMAEFEGASQVAADVKRNQQQQALLVGYVVWAPNYAPQDELLLNFLKKRLPEYMLPQMFVPLEALPRTLNGKLHRQQLPNPVEGADLPMSAHQLKDQEDDEVNEWPPSVKSLSDLVLDVTQAVVTGRVGSTVVNTKAPSPDMEWRHFGLTSSMAGIFSAALTAQLLVRWPQIQSTMQSLAPSIMFEHPTLAQLVHFLQDALRTPSVVPHGLVPTEANGDEIRHVVSLGSLCMTAQVMKSCGLRRWPGPFDWFFSDLGMVTHCLQDNFAAFLRRSEYFAVDGAGEQRVGHKMYSNHVFDWHNPMLPDDYDFLAGCVDSLRGLLWDWPREAVIDKEGDLETGNVLFLFFNLERRGALSQSAVLQLFEQLCNQCRHPFELLVVNVLTTSGETKPRHRLLLRQNRRANQVLLVHDLHCVGTHEQFKLLEEADEAALRSILLNSSVSSEGQCAKCHSAPRSFDLSPGPPMMRTSIHSSGQAKSAADDGTVGGSLDGEASTLSRPATSNGYNAQSQTSTRSDRFRAALLQAQELQESAPGSLALMAAPLRKLLRHIGRSVEGALKEMPTPATVTPSTTPSPPAPSASSGSAPPASSSEGSAPPASSSEGTNLHPEQDRHWHELYVALRCHPVHVTSDGLCRIWCPRAQHAQSALLAIVQWRPVPSESGVANANKFRALLLLPASLVRAQLDDSKDLEIVYSFKTNTELFSATEPTSQIVVKLPRSAQEYVVIGRRGDP